jgi:seryl-tRNA synthetase
MLDIKIIRQNPDLVKYSIEKRNMEIDLDRFLFLDKQIIELKQKSDQLRSIKNKVSREIPLLEKEVRNEKVEEMKKL